MREINPKTFLLLCFKRILPLHDADAGPADRVLECETEQSPRRPRGCRRGLFLGFGAIVLSLPLCGTGRRDGPAPSRPESRSPTWRGVAHHLRLPRSVDGRLPAQGRPRRGDVFRCEANHTHSVVGPAPSSTSIAMAADTTVLVCQARMRRARKRRGRVIGAWKEKRRRKQNVSKLRSLNTRKSIDHFLLWRRDSLFG